VRGERREHRAVPAAGHRARPGGCQLGGAGDLSKYDHHPPLYRQQQQFERLGLNFPRQTLCDWVEQGAGWLQAIVREMKRELLAGDYLQVNETPVRVLDPEVKGR
jgi:hypothetical protein